MINRDPTNRTPRPVPSIADPYWDLLARLDEGRRLGMVRRLAVGFYEGWLPSRDEVALLVDAELGRITQDEFLGAHSEPRPEGSSRPPPTNGYAGNPKIRNDIQLKIYEKIRLYSSSEDLVNIANLLEIQNVKNGKNRKYEKRKNRKIYL